METEEDIKKTLDKLLKNAKTSQEFVNAKFLIDDYLEQGYHIKSYIFKYNLSYQKFLDKK